MNLQKNLLTIIHSLPDLYLILSPELIILDASDSYLKATNQTRENVINNYCFDIYTENPHRAISNAIKNVYLSFQKVIETKTPDLMPLFKYDIDVDGHNNFEERYWIANNFPVLDENGKLLCIIHRAEDVTEFVKLKLQSDKNSIDFINNFNKAQEIEAEIYHHSRNLEEINKKLLEKNTELQLRQAEVQKKNIELEKAIKAKDKFFNSMSHELRTPLNAILGFTALLLMQMPGVINPMQQKQLKIIKSSSQHLLSLINDLLKLTDIEAGNVNFDFNKINLNDFLQELKETLFSITEAKGIKLNVRVNNINDKLIFISNRDAMSQIIVNLVSIIMKYLDEGEINIDIYQEQKNLKIEVQTCHLNLSHVQQKKICKLTQLSQIKEIPDSMSLRLFLTRRLAHIINAEIDCDPSKAHCLKFTITQYPNEVMTQEIEEEMTV